MARIDRARRVQHVAVRCHHERNFRLGLAPGKGDLGGEGGEVVRATAEGLLEVAGEEVVNYVLVDWSGAIGGGEEVDVHVGEGGTGGEGVSEMFGDTGWGSVLRRPTVGNLGRPLLLV